MSPPGSSSGSDPGDDELEPALEPPEGLAITGVLATIRSGDRAAFDQLLPLVYDMLRRMARRHLRGRDQHTLGATGLVHEAWLKLVDSPRAEWTDRAHFFRVAAIAMRQILIGYARARAREKRGGEFKQVTLDDSLASPEDRATALVELDDALVHLASLDERLVHVVECRFFAGLSEDETALALGVTSRTVRRDWVKARALLHELLAA
jgi:RNA polymerase sigma factor (TIGR02999 family)